MLQRVFLFTWLLFGSALTAAAQTPTSGKIQIVERGIYRAETLKKVEQPGTTGLINTVENVRLIVSTTSIVGQVGVRFGLRYIVPGSNSEVPLKLVIAFPPPGLRNSRTEQVFYFSEHMITVSAGVTQYWEYHFENEWEIVAGFWYFQFWHQNQKLGEQRFCVQELIRRSLALGLTSECGGGLLDSNSVGPL